MISDTEMAQHYRDGVKDNCLVCDRELVGDWTDYNGQIRCHTCGTTYQILGCHLRQEFLEKMGLKEDEVARVYCDCFEVVPILRDYWQQTEHKIPFGDYFLSAGPISREERVAFGEWLAANADKYQPDYPESLNWNALREKYLVTK